MKVCKYCNSESENDAKFCASCGANDFSYKCDNCGTVYSEGLFCPKCGVKAGQEAKICPNCSTKYFSNACPNCGYNGEQKNTVTVEKPVKVVIKPTVEVASPSYKKRRTWLWVLGWICIFPVPLTILLLRNQQMSKGLKYAIIAIAWVLYFVIALTGESSTTLKNSSPDATAAVESYEYEIPSETLTSEDI